jgi:hypothetical protein
MTNADEGNHQSNTSRRHHVGHHAGVTARARGVWIRVRERYKTDPLKPALLVLLVLAGYFIGQLVVTNWVGGAILALLFGAASIWIEWRKAARDVAWRVLKKRPPRGTAPD